MQEYYGTPRKIKAKPMTRGEYNDYLGKLSPIPFDFKGYLIKFEDGETGWTTNDVLGAAYQPTYALSFGHALEVLKSGGRVARSGWDLKDVFLEKYEGVICLNSAGRKTNAKIDAWSPSQTDMLANDWSVLPDESRTAEVQIAPPEEETLNE